MPFRLNHFAYKCKINTGWEIMFHVSASIAYTSEGARRLWEMSGGWGRYPTTCLDVIEWGALAVTNFAKKNGP